jgi:hypothetical protein
MVWYCTTNRCKTIALILKQNNTTTKPLNQNKMNLENAKPHATYEGLKIQFFALKNMLKCKESEIEVYRKRQKEFNIDRIIQLEAELESQKEMNAILTEELTFKTN